MNHGAGSTPGAQNFGAIATAIPYSPGFVLEITAEAAISSSIGPLLAVVWL